MKYWNVPDKEINSYLNTKDVFFRELPIHKVNKTNMASMKFLIFRHKELYSKY